MTTDESWRERYLVSAAISNPGERSALYRATERGLFRRVTRGAYLPASEWDGLDIEGRHVARMRAVELTHPGTVFSHLSAAIIHGLPVVGGDLSIPYSVAARASGGRSMNGLRRFAIGLPPTVTVVGGLHVTTIADTAIQVASTCAPETSIPILDVALRPEHRLDLDALREATAQMPTSSGSARCSWALDFADPSSGSPGESLSRVGIHRLRLPAPELQCGFSDAGGLIGIVDFWWPDVNLIGEFDGLGKYLRTEFTGGRLPADIVIDEKRREDRLRATGRSVVRWGWAAARDRSTLRGILTGAGLRGR